MSKVRVLVVDDSALMRKLLSEMLESDPEIEVVGTAMDAFAARDKIKELKPDVLTLDIEMPKMDGVTFLSKLMRLQPMPVVMVSALTTEGAALTMRALDLGAVDFVSKPTGDVAGSLENYAEEITTKVKTAAKVSVRSLYKIAARTDADSHPVTIPTARKSGSVNNKITDRVIAIGASTGGTEAIKEVLIRLNPDCPGIVITQHIPPVFSRSFAERMNHCSKLTVVEAEDGQQILPGHAYIAPGGKHLEVTRDGTRYRCRLHHGEEVNRHRPSVDVMFDSVAKRVGKSAVGVILTGVGRDGAKGLRHMQDAGAKTVAQDEQSCIVWGMPKAAVEEGGVDKEMPLQHIAAKITELVHC